MTAGAAADVYNDLAPNGRKLSSSEATKARDQLVALSICLRDIHDDDDIISLLVADGQRIGMDADLRPTISFMRMMQRGFGLALSDVPGRRKQAMPLEELGRYAAAVVQFWRGL
jgi:hypothetical protein